MCYLCGSPAIQLARRKANPMTNNRGAQWFYSWYDAFIDNGRNDAAAMHLAAECETWQANNPTMSWQDIFDAVLLSDETRGE